MSKMITRDWSQLYSELTEKFAETLTEIPDYIRFGAVCKQWLSAARSVPRPRQLPWLLVEERAAEFRFLSPSENWRRYTIPLPVPLKIFPLRTFGAAYGLVVIESETASLTLLNPLVPASWLPLPRLPLENILDLEVSAVEEVKVYKTGDGENAVTCVLANLLHSTPYLWKSGEESWTKLNENDWDVGFFLHYRGSFYVHIIPNRETVVIDASTLKITKEIPPPVLEERCSAIYLVESSSGELLMVAWDTERKVEVFRLDLVGSNWVKAGDIGDDIMFLRGEREREERREEGLQRMASLIRTAALMPVSRSMMWSRHWLCAVRDGGWITISMALVAMVITMMRMMDLNLLMGGPSSGIQMQDAVDDNENHHYNGEEVVGSGGEEEETVFKIRLRVGENKVVIYLSY